MVVDRSSFLPLRLGQVVSTPGALAAFAEAGVSPMTLLVRHSAGDWGTVCDEDWEANELALVAGERILSVYRLDKIGVAVWIITERDRSVTTFLLPSEY